MRTLGPESTNDVFENKPSETATWLVSLDTFAALHKVTRGYQIVEHEDEFAAKRLIKTLGHGDYTSTYAYFTKPEAHRPGMPKLVKKLGAVSLNGQIDIALNAAMAFKLEKNTRATLDRGSLALALYENAQDFPEYFVEIAERRLSSSYKSLVDIVLMVKNDTSYWIDRDIAS